MTIDEIRQRNIGQGGFRELWAFLPVLPTDYTDYGGEVERWAKADESYPDCSCGCRFACFLEGSGDWLVCANPASPRAGLLTWEHQAGCGCYVPEERDEDESEITLVFPELGDVRRRVHRIEEFLLRVGFDPEWP